MHMQTEKNREMQVEIVCRLLVSPAQCLVLLSRVLFAFFGCIRDRPVLNAHTCFSCLQILKKDVTIVLETHR